MGNIRRRGENPQLLILALELNLTVQAVRHLQRIEEATSNEYV